MSVSGCQMGLLRAQSRLHLWLFAGTHDIAINRKGSEKGSRSVKGVKIERTEQRACARQLRAHNNGG